MQHTPLTTPRGYDTWLAVGHTNLKVHRVLNQLLGTLDLSLAQHEILLTIQRCEGLTQSELAARLHVIKSNASALINRLEARGLVRRTADRADARIRRLSLTDAGQALVRRSFAVQARVVEAMVSVMSDDELERMATLMDRISASLDALAEPDAHSAAAPANTAGETGPDP
ncbi:MAG: MarR family transcriptional regulator [Pseudomonadota bacterium]